MRIIVEINWFIALLKKVALMMGNNNGKCCRLLVILAGAVVIIDVIIFNICLFYGFGFLLQLNLAFEETSFKGGLHKFPFGSSFVQRMKEGGFKTLEHDTLGRLILKSYKVPPEIRTNRTGDYLSFVDLDVTHAGEGSFIARRMLSNPPGQEVPRLVVDIGANDAFMSSNSNFFIRLGWDAVLVEPVEKLIELAKNNLAWHLDPVSKQRPPNIRFVQAVIGESDGYVELAMSQDAASMESHMLNEEHPKVRGQAITKVKSLSVQSFVRKYDIPKQFGILSIDVEGFGDKILKKFLDLGHRPSYIISETLGIGSPVISSKEVESMGYTFLTHIGHNNIFEFHGNNDKGSHMMKRKL